ncbi:MAG: O-antigen ligase family protein [Betaproteobacteria bacterium]|nr:O-antigen ligase family protein [Betaproteobacteria bacterium]
MFTASANARQSTVQAPDWLLDRPPAGGRSWRRIAFKLAALGGLALLGALWGAAVAFANLNALYLCVSLIGCVFILRDFRIGVVLLILLLPISRSYLFPHAMLGITGLNPFNLLLAGTLGSCLLHGLFDGTLRRFMPRPLLWLYIVPILVAGALGSRRVGDIAPGFFMYDMVAFYDAAGYLRELVAKPLMMVVFALLVGAAVSRSEKPERFLIPTLVSIWVMGAVVVVYFFLSGVALGELASSSSRGFLSALGLHANDLGRLYAVAYALLLFTWAESREPGLRLALLASMALVVVALLLTFSRGAFLGFLVVNGLFLLWRANARTLAFIGLLTAVALLLLPDAVYDRMTTGFGGGLNAISAGRIEGIWLPLLPEVMHSPIYGNGLGSILWSEAMRRTDGVTILGTTHPHNAYLEALLDVGIAGLVLLCAFYAHVWKGFRALSVDPAVSPALRGFYLGATAGLASFLIAALVDSSLAPRSEQAFLWLAIGMMYGQLARRPDHEPGRDR